MEPSDLRCSWRVVFFFSSRRRHTRCSRDWSSDVCSSDLYQYTGIPVRVAIAPTKCLTKIACELLKSDEQYADVLDMTKFADEQLDQALEIGRASCRERV